MFNRAALYEVFEQVQEAICILSSFGRTKASLENIKTQLPDTENFSLGEALETYLFLLEAVFKYLDRSDLRNVKQVNSTWCKLAVDVLNKRNEASWLVCNSRDKSLLSSSGFIFNNVAAALVFYNPEYIMLENFVCLHSTKGTVRMPFADYISKDVICADIDYFAIACTPIYVFNTLIPSKIGLEDILLRHHSVYQCLLLPEIPKISISFHHCTVNRSPPLAKGRRVRCVLMFTQEYVESTFLNFINLLPNSKDFHSFAIGGGTVTSANCFIRNSTEKLFYTQDVYCVLFSQKLDEEVDFDAYSVVLDCSNYEAGLIQFQNQVVPRKHGVIYSFGPALGEYGTETLVLKKYFPKYQYLCVELEQQIGWTTENVKTMGKATALKSSRHFMSIVLVVITWGPKKKQ